MKTLFRKELADIFTSVRFLILLIVALLVCAATLYADYKGIRGMPATDFVFLRLYTTTTAEIPSLFSFMNFMALFLVPIIGISLGFDAISSERHSGTLSRILAQPIYRDSVINAKFLAGLVTLAIMVATTVFAIGGLGLRMVGVPPSSEEVMRLILYMVYTVVNGAFWMGLAMLFSNVFRSTATALLTSIGLWLVLGFFFIFLIVPSLANVLTPMIDNNAASIIKNIQFQSIVLRFSPSYLYLEVSSVLLEPPLAGSLLGVIGVIASGAANWMIPNPLSLGQTLLLVWPHLTGMLALTVIVFAMNYIMLVKQEIRST